MPVDKTLVGQEGVVVERVEAALTADRYGNAGLDALATPALVGLFEQAAMRVLAGVLAAGEGSVVDVTHLAPTPVGAEVTVRARVAEVDGRQVWFVLEAEDGRETIARGRHSRVIVGRERFQRLLERKRT
jgi:fluoroacetyl-CoA thioesterase